MYRLRLAAGSGLFLPFLGCIAASPPEPPAPLPTTDGTGNVEVAQDAGVDLGGASERSGPTTDGAGDGTTDTSDDHGQGTGSPNGGTTDAPSDGDSGSTNDPSDGQSGDTDDDSTGSAELMCGATLREYQGTASATMYWFDQGTVLPNCSNAVTARGKGSDAVAEITTGGGMYFGAINTTDYADAAACGACVEVSRDDGRKVVVTVVDQCPVATNDKCVAGHIDLSVPAFLQLGTEDEGYIGARAGRGSLSLRYVPCPAGQNLMLGLKEPRNRYWNQVLVVGNRYAIAKVEVHVGGKWVAAKRETYNYWTPKGGNMGKSPYRVRVTDIRGGSVEAEIAVGTAGLHDTGVQLPDCP